MKYRFKSDEENQNEEGVVLERLSRILLTDSIFDTSEPPLDELDNAIVYIRPDLPYLSTNFHLPHPSCEREYDGPTPNTQNDIDD